MHRKINGGVAAVIIILFTALILWFGYNKVTGGPDADVTQEVINRYRNLSKQGEAANKLRLSAHKTKTQGKGTTNSH